MYTTTALRGKNVVGTCLCLLGLVLIFLHTGTHRWAQVAIPLIGVANFFVSGLAVQPTLKSASGLVIEANFFS